jgi:diacylglycerol kinase (ATP)
MCDAVHPSYPVAMDESHESPHEDAAAPPSIGLGRVVKAFGYSLDGLAGAWRTEGAFRQEVIAAVLLVPIACLVPVSLLERALLVGSVLMVMVVELLNSSIESAIDRISLERHPLSKRAKDTGSAAVLVAIVIALLTWGAVLAPWMRRVIAG